MLGTLTRWIRSHTADVTLPGIRAAAPAVTHAFRPHPTGAPAHPPHGPLVVDIKGNSLDDGPGIRTVVFLKGCPLACVWCHNPECRSPLPELAFAAAQCIECRTCVDACSDAAIVFDECNRVDRTRCTLCGRCAEVCPAQALSMLGGEMTVEAIAAEALKDKPFFDASGGGVTVSGGEPTLHMGFLSELLEAMKLHGLHTLVETCGLFSFDRFVEQILPWVDSIYFDLKLFDPALHQRFCGVSNERILDNFTRLHAMSPAQGFEVLPRVPLVPGITATRENLELISAFLHDLGVRAARLLPYNPTWRDKEQRLGCAGPASALALPMTWMPGAEVAECARIFTQRDISVDERDEAGKRWA